MDDLEEYGSIFFRYFPEVGTYYIYDTVITQFFGWLSLQKGPGWVFFIASRVTCLDYDIVSSITEMMDDLNAEIEQEELVELFSFGKLEPVKTIRINRRQGFDE